MIRTILALIADRLQLLRLIFRSRAQLAAEHLFLRKQLALYVERKVRPKRATSATRVALVSRLGRMDGPLQWRAATFRARSWAAGGPGATRRSDRSPTNGRAPGRSAKATWELHHDYQLEHVAA